MRSRTKLILPIILAFMTTANSMSKSGNLPGDEFARRRAVFWWWNIGVRIEDDVLVT